MRYKTQDFSKLDTKLIDNAWTVFKDSTTLGGTKTRTLKLETIATHSGKPINNRVYPGVRVKDAAKSFRKGDGTSFEKPFLLNHDREKDPIGRVKGAEYMQTATGKDFLNDHLEPTAKGSGFLKVNSIITDQDAIEKFLDGRYQTVSVSGSTDGAFCNICSKARGELHPMWESYKSKDNSDMVDCRHIPGKIYDSVKCHLITGAIDYAELSQVNVPADGDAVHVAKDIVMADSLESSLWQFFDAAGTMDLLSVPVRFGIVDSEGNTIQGLDTDTYKSNKTFSIPQTTKPEAQSTSGGDKPSISDEEFAKLHTLKHFSDLGMLKLTDAQKVEVNKLSGVVLTQTQSGILQDSFIIHPAVPFNIHDKYHYKVVLDLLDSDLTVDKTRWKSALDEAAKTHNIFKDDNAMDLEALKKALADAQARLTTLEADVKGKDATIADQKAKLETAEGKLKAIADADRKQAVEKVIALRTELKLADTKDLADAAKKEATLKTLNDKFGVLDVNVLKIMADDLQAQKETLAALSDKALENPLTKAPEAGKETIADSKNTPPVPKADLKPTELL